MNLFTSNSSSRHFGIVNARLHHALALCAVAFLFSSFVKLGAEEPFSTANVTIDLGGQWLAKLDPHDLGHQSKWFQEDFTETSLNAVNVQLPGSIQHQGLGNDPSTETPWVTRVAPMENYPSWYSADLYAKYRTKEGFRFPYWLQPKKHYVGLVWFQRSIEISEDATLQRQVLLLERTHWKTSVWIDGETLGSQDSLVAPHRYDCTKWLTPGTHRLTIAVDNRMIHDVGINAHSVTDHTQTAWNGIIGRIELIRMSNIQIDDIQVFPDVDRRFISVRSTIKRTEGTPPTNGRLRLSIDDRNIAKEVDFDLDDEITTITTQLPMPKSMRLWDEFNPVLYQMRAVLTADATQNLKQSSEITDARKVTFGIRKVETKGTQILVNGNPLFLRGTLECCVFPKTGYPPTDVDAWLRIMRIAKEFGLNHLRFHSWCPPKAAFIAADQVGIYLQPEPNLWAPTGKEGTAMCRFFQDEWNRILREFGNHPSFLMLCFGNESHSDSGFANDWIEQSRKTDPRRVYSYFANGYQTSIKQGVDADFDIQVSLTRRPLSLRQEERIRIQAGWPPTPDGSLIITQRPGTNTDYRSMIRQFGKPLIQHETVQRCVYPRLSDDAKYSGSLTPGYLPIARDQMIERGMIDQNDDFIAASGAWQVQQFKEEIEAALRTPGMAGFQLLGLHDFPGQGGALVGVLDAFWDSKGYIDAASFRRFCAPTVPLARMEKLVWTADETWKAEIEVSHYATQSLLNAAVQWEVTDPSGLLINKGTFQVPNIIAGDLTSIGTIEFPLDQFVAPAKYRLQVSIADTDIRNDWEFWVYPSEIEKETSQTVLVAGFLDEAAQQHLSKGGKVLLLPDPASIRGGLPQCFSSIYWNCPWTDGGESQTLGILVDPKHPLFKAFPTDSHTNWQWWDLLTKATPMVLDQFDCQTPWPKTSRPLVQLIDDWNQNRKLAVVAEASVGKGKIIVCSIDLETDLENRVVARQFRHALLSYMNSDSFEPRDRVSIQSIKRLYREPSPLQKRGATIVGDSSQPGYGAELAIDGDIHTFWHTQWGPIEELPHHLILDLIRPTKLDGMTYLPRQDLANGRIAKYQVYVSDDGKNWNEPVATGEWPRGTKRQTVYFDFDVSARFVKFVALQEVSGKPFASVAEIDVLTEPVDDR